MVIEVDFDLAMTVLACNLLRLLALDLPHGYRHLSARSLCERLLCTAADLEPGLCAVSLKNKRDLSALSASGADRTASSKVLKTLFHKSSLQ